MRFVIIVLTLTAAASAVGGKAAPSFQAAVAELPQELRDKMQGVSMHEGCPVPASELRLITLSYWDFEGKPQTGKLIVHQDVAVEVAELFRGLFRLRFPIERMELIHVYGGDDARSMEANNTSAFNCRFVTGRKGVFSKHSYGRAVDINPRTNPYVKGDHVEPESGRAFVDRTRDVPGMLRVGDEAVRIFKEAGWTWGGDWKSLKDYQHFEKKRTNKKKR
jgi:hypothetical protein